MSSGKFLYFLTIRSLSAALSLLVFSVAHSQISFPGMSFNKTILPDTVINQGSYDLLLDPELPDVKSIGRGVTSVSGEQQYIGMLMNPAFLAKEKISIEFADAQISIPNSTLDAISYLSSNKENLEDGRFLKQLKTGVDNLRTYGPNHKREEGLAQIYDASVFGDELLTNVIGSYEDPTQHGFLAFPNLKIQYKNFGFSIHKVTQGSFIVSSGHILDIISKIHKLESETPDDDMLIRLAGQLYNIYQTKDILRSDALPTIYSLAASNTAFSFGYGHNINNQLSLGANIHLYRRSFTADIVRTADLEQLVDIIAAGLEDPIYELNLTIGADYYFKPGLSAGIVAANFLPSKTLTAQTKVSTYEAKIDYEIYGESWLDSVAVNINSQEQTLVNTYNLSIPFILSIGSKWSTLPYLNLSAEWADILANDNVRYNQYAERIRLGAEAIVLKEIVSFRVGFANLKPTIGAGISLPIKSFSIDLDAAYAHLILTNSYATYIQLKLALDIPTKK